MWLNPERYLNKSVTEIKADAGAAKATNALVKADDKSQKEEKSTSTKPESKTEDKSQKKRNQQAVQLVTKRRTEERRKINKWFYRII